jgi:Ser/Thr protein kinase RdoA (MazF antagonist)
VIPKEIRSAYRITGKAVVRKLNGGMVNTTYLIRDGKSRRFILQKLSPVFSEKMISDTAVIVANLKQQGWDVPSPIINASEKFSSRDKAGGLWRAVEFISSDARVPNKLGRKEIKDIGRILAKMHSALARIDHRPEFKIPHFHDTNYYAAKLSRLLPRLSLFARSKAEKCLKQYRELRPLSHDVQLIHGDPRVDNILFRGGIAYTMIDFDTVMLSNIWVDVGDLVRSLIERSIELEIPLPEDWLNTLGRGYTESAHSVITLNDFSGRAVAAGKTIALELAMRFWIDVVEDSYFDWNKHVYPSRKSQNNARAELQWGIFRELDSRSPKELLV